MFVKHLRVVLQLAAVLAVAVLAAPAQAGDFVAGVTDVPSVASDMKDEFIPGVTDVPSVLRETDGQFVPGVTDVPSASAYKPAPHAHVDGRDYGMPQARVDTAPTTHVDGRDYGIPQEPPAGSPSPAVPSTSSGLEWSDAAIALALGAAALLLAAGGVLLARTRAHPAQ